MSESKRLAFDRFVVDVTPPQLWKLESEKKLTDEVQIDRQSLDIVVFLAAKAAAHPDRVVQRVNLEEAIWGHDNDVSDDAFRTALHRANVALGQNPDRKNYIKTHRGNIRFHAKVRVFDDDVSEDSSDASKATTKCESSDISVLPAIGNDFDFVAVTTELQRARSLLDVNPKGPEEFYDGSRADWRDIVQNFDSPRERLTELQEFILQRAEKPTSRIPVAVVLGESGDGKTTALMRTAASLASCNHLVFFQKDHKFALRVPRLRQIADNQPVFLFVDKLTELDPTEFKGFIDWLQRESIHAIVVVGVWPSTWPEYKPNSAVAELREIDIGRWTDKDIDGYLDKLGSILSGAFLGNLAGLTRPQQHAAFLHAGRSFLVAMLMAKRNKVFEEYVKGELDRLPGHARRAYLYVSAFHRFDLAMPRQLLVSLLPDHSVDDVVFRQARGLLVESGDWITTRHSLRAEVAIATDEVPLVRRYEDIIDASSKENEGLIARLLHILSVRRDNGVEALFIRARRRFDSPCFPHMQALYKKRQGDHSEAKRLFRDCTRLFPHDAPSWQAWGLLEKEQGNLGDRDHPEENSARWLFRMAIKADPTHPHGWQALGCLEAEAGNFGSVDDAWSARDIFKRGHFAAGAHPPLIRAWLLAEQQAPDCNIGASAEDRYSVRWLYDELTKLPHPEISATFGN
ncbi:MAG: hypothetical protein FD138_2392, partial [Planctomycetota bacterium]